MTEPPRMDPPPGDDEGSERDSESESRNPEIPEISGEDKIPGIESSDIPPEIVQRVSAAWFSGPLPPPDILRAYKDIEPTAFDVILEMARNEQDQRHDTERRMIRQVSSGVRYGVVIFLALLALAGFALHEGQVTAFIAIALSEFAGLLAIYFRRVRNGSRESGSESE